MPFLSIIIPVYNVEDYIEDCLNSILQQNFNDYEVILVDDASTDRSGAICDQYASIHSNIRAIHLAVNSYPGAARNIGLQYAKGDYIHFCDSDDYYVHNSFGTIIDILSKKAPDVLVGQFISKPEKGAFVCNDVIFDSEVFENGNAQSVVEHMLHFPNLMGTPCRFVVNRKFLLGNNIIFPEGCYAEDEEWFPKVICSANQFALLETAFYCYRPRAKGSITSRKTYFHSKSILLVLLNLLQFLKHRQYVDVRKTFILSRVNFLVGIFLTRCDTFTSMQIRELADMIRDQLDYFQILGELHERREFLNTINHYGPYEGLTLYCIKVVDATLELVKGKESHNIYIFPTGNNGEGTARILQNAGYGIEGFLDNSYSKNGCTIDNLPVSLPQVLVDMTLEQLNNIFVVVSVQQKEVANIIRQQLRHYGVDDSHMVSRIY